MGHELVSYFVHKHSFPSVPATSDSEMRHMCPSDLDKLRYNTFWLMQHCSKLFCPWWHYLAQDCTARNLRCPYQTLPVFSSVYE
jgi:hypothetical protein